MSTIGNEQVEEDASSETTIMPDNYESFFADGRLLVKVGKDANVVNFQVSLSVFRLARPVWRTLKTRTDVSLAVDSGWETVDQMIEFPNDQPGAFRILFGLAHLQFHNAPSHVSLKDLADLAEASYDYKMGSMVRPYVRDWQKPHIQQGLSHAVVSDWLWIGRIWAVDDMLDRTLRYVMVDMSELEVQNLFKIGSAFLDHIVNDMKKMMKDIMDVAYELLGEIKDDGLTCEYPGSSDDDKSQCEFQRSAAILVFLKTFKLPMENNRASSQGWTVPSLASVHVAAQLMEKRARRTIFGVAHENCVVGMSEFVQDLGEALEACPIGDINILETARMSV